MLDCHGKARAFAGTTRQEKEGHELTDSVTSRPEIPLFQREIPLSQLGWLLQSLWADSWQPDLPQARLFRSFARTPLGVRHSPGCRCICSWLRCRGKTGSGKYSFRAAKILLKGKAKSPKGRRKPLRGGPTPDPIRAWKSSPSQQLLHNE